MNILCTNFNLINPGGSETFTYTLSKELARRGHEVEVTAFLAGEFMERFTHAKLNPQPGPEYDLMLVNHAPCLQELRNVKGRKILTCHGTLGVENPTSGADRYVAISEEVQRHMKTAGYEAEVIFNGVDCERFRPINPINKHLTSVYSLCQGEQANDMVKEACRIAGWQFSDKRGFDVEQYINESDLVVSLGRGVYEAMACGRSVLVFDSRHYMGLLGDGLLTWDNIEESKRFNCSGRAFKKRFGIPNLIAEMEKYNPVQGAFNREHALENMNIEKQVERYLK